MRSTGLGLFVSMMIGFAFAGALIYALTHISNSATGFWLTMFIFAGVISTVAGGLAAYREQKISSARQIRITEVEQKLAANPEKPLLAWDLARIKLESYLDRNLSQVRSIFSLTLLVMSAGLAFILYGLIQAFQSPERLNVAIVASASGVLVSFIGGSFLIIYRSILEQTKGYVSVLERINAVGMAVNVISNIPDENAALKHSTTAELAKQLLTLYAKREEVRGEPQR